MKITLLTHFKEFAKRSNTGRLVIDVLGSSAEQICWDRVNPPAGLVAEIAAGGVALVYPGTAGEHDCDLSGITRLILIDSTWHEARKIHQKSPYLLHIRRIGLRTGQKSVYNLRKNQKESGLCTAECVIEVLRQAGNGAEADLLHERLLAFIRPEGAMRGAVQGH
jgi:DTW domain-containing protein YfiP